VIREARVESVTGLTWAGPSSSLLVVAERHVAVLAFARGVHDGLEPLEQAGERPRPASTRSQSAAIAGLDASISAARREAAAVAAAGSGSGPPRMSVRASRCAAPGSGSGVPYPAAASSRAAAEWSPPW
jgi:hypothetical protein